MEQGLLEIQYSEKFKQNLSDDQLQFFQTWNEKVSSYRSCYKKIYCNGNKNEKKIALTFDDAPDAYCTPQILDILKRLRVQAGFSVIGLHIEENKKLLKRIYQEKHTIINHTYRHYELPSLSKEELYNEIKKTEELIYDLIGVKPSMIRPPYGILSDSVVAEIERLNYGILLWSYDTCDCVVKTADDILDNMCDSIRPGEVILMHSYENKESTVAALEPLIIGLQANGFEIVPMEELFDIKCYRELG